MAVHVQIVDVSLNSGSLNHLLGVKFYAFYLNGINLNLVFEQRQKLHVYSHIIDLEKCVGILNNINALDLQIKRKPEINPTNRDFHSGGLACVVRGYANHQILNGRKI